MIDKLTAEQEKLLVEMKEKACCDGTTIKPINKKVIESVITKLHKEIEPNMEKPTFLYFDSPYSCQIALNLYNDINDKVFATKSELTKMLDLKQEKTTKNYYYPYFCGQFDLYWSTFYIFCEKIGVEYDKENKKMLYLWDELSKNSHFWWWSEKVIFVSERPIRMAIVNEQLHCETAAAIEYKDGYKQYYLNGISVPEWLVMTPKEDLNFEQYAKIKNVEVKKEFLRKYGIERMENQGVLIDSQEYCNYKLIDMEKFFPNLDYVPYLFMDCLSTNERHGEPVHPDCTTIQQANNYRAGNIKIKWNPVSLT